VTGLVLGIDAGGTKTQAAIADARGRVLGLGLAGSGNVDDVGIEGVRCAFAQAVAEARREAGYDGPLASGFVGAAGIVSEADRAAVAAASEGLAERIEVDHDCRVALAGALDGAPGAVLIAGTGSVCYGRLASGADHRAGGWGDLVGDEGSSHWLGVEAMRAAVRSADGRGPRSVLEPMVVERLGLSGMDQLLHKLYLPRLPRADIAALAPVVFEAAAGADEAAAGLVSRACQHLAECVAAVAVALDWDTGTELPVGMIGGLFRAGDQLIRPLEKALALAAPYARLLPPLRPPVEGACRLALGRP
jgi:N-acetylglucosamine kinase-like BadF-type ATPase